MSTISLIVAMAETGVIGKDGTMPWRIPEDLRHFKALTLGKPCIMGRKTWDSLPRKPLPGRTNIVITRDADFRAEGAEIAHSLDEAIAQAGDADEIMIIGGAHVFAQALPRATRIYLTEIHAGIEGDTRMPPFDHATWHAVAREDHTTADGLRYSYITLERSHALE